MSTAHDPRPPSARVEHLASALDEAARLARPLPGGDTGLADDGTDTAYAVQAALVARRLARGERATGVKLGFTSRAKMRQMGVSDLIHGRLTDAMAIPDGAVHPVDDLIHPRVEPEIAFLLGHALTADGDPAAAVAAVAPALEVIDSRYDGFRFSLAEVVADNTSAARYVLGPWRTPGDGHELGNLGVLLELDGRLAQSGSTAAILGHPLRALAAAARLTGPLPAGTVVLAGAATAAVPLPPDTHVRATVAGLGSVRFTTAPADPHRDREGDPR
ncbi:2-keto-4-pentenoate hydratase (plasmid) [Streptomyces sp. BI20]|uniref:2-keto-4-pentenoate hydratase n=1 Tax=Streptomyces sp. BI20 TaxID=3403460 RepID=UPI003C7529F2